MQSGKSPDQTWWKESSGCNTNFKSAVAVRDGYEGVTRQLQKTTVDGTTEYMFPQVLTGDRVTIGVDYLPAALESESTETVVDDQKSKDDGASAKATNKVSVEFENLTTAYVALNITDTLYVKGGIMQVDVNTEENLGTGSKYGNVDIMGIVAGVGIQNENMRVELVYTDYEDVSLTSTVARTGVTTNNKIDADLDTLAFKYSYVF